MPDVIEQLVALKNEALDERDEARKLLENLTPGGSEFSGDPVRCAEFVRNCLDSVIRLKKERDSVVEQRNILEKYLREARDDLYDNLSVKDVMYRLDDAVKRAESWKKEKE